VIGVTSISFNFHLNLQDLLLQDERLILCFSRTAIVSEPSHKVAFVPRPFGGDN